MRPNNWSPDDKEAWAQVRRLERHVELLKRACELAQGVIDATLIEAKRGGWADWKLKRVELAQQALRDALKEVNCT